MPGPAWSLVLVFGALAVLVAAAFAGNGWTVAAMLLVIASQTALWRTRSKR